MSHNLRVLVKKTQNFQRRRMIEICTDMVVMKFRIPLQPGNMIVRDKVVHVLIRILSAFTSNVHLLFTGDFRAEVSFKKHLILIKMCLYRFCSR